MDNITQYKELFLDTNIKTCTIPNFCFYSLLTDSLMDGECINKFKLNYDEGMEVYYKGKLIQIIKEWEFADFLKYKTFISIFNRNFGKDGFENFLISIRADEQLKKEFVYDIVDSPFCNLRDLEYLFTRFRLTKELMNNNLGYTKFTKHELNEYKNFVDWEHLLINKKEIDNDFLSKYRKEIKTYIHNKFPDSYYHEIKYISFWLCINPNIDWERKERYLKVYNYHKHFPGKCVDELTREIEFPKDYYFNYFIENKDCFEKFRDNINLKELKNNKFLPTEIIQILVDQEIEENTYTHNFGNYYFLTIQQFIQLEKYKPNWYSNQNFCFKTFGVYQYNKYKGLIEDNPVVMKKFSYMLTNSTNGKEEFFRDFD